MRKDFRVYNKITKKTKESIYITFDESNPKLVEVEVIDYACIMWKSSLEHDEELNQEKNENQVIEEESVPVPTLNTP